LQLFARPCRPLGRRSVVDGQTLLAVTPNHKRPTQTLGRNLQNYFRLRAGFLFNHPQSTGKQIRRIPRTFSISFSFVQITIFQTIENRGFFLDSRISVQVDLSFKSLDKNINRSDLFAIFQHAFSFMLISFSFE
jgi:hypothetical protein